MRIILTLFIIVLLPFQAVYAAAGTVDPASSTPDSRFAAALERFDSDDFTQAARLSLGIAKDNPGTVWEGRALLLAARAYGDSGDIDTASSYFAKAAQKHAVIADYAYYLNAELLFKSERYDEAAAMYQRVADGYPKSALASRALLKAGDALVRCEKYKEAEAPLERLLSRGPGRDDASRANLLLMEAGFGAGDYKSAYDRYMTLWLKYPGSESEKSASGMPARLRDAGFDQPGFGLDDYIKRAEREAKLGRYSGASKDWKRALDMMPDGHPKRGDALTGLGRAYYGLREHANAEKYLKKVVQDDGFKKSAPEAFYWLARTYLRTGAQENFRKTVLDCSEHFPGHERTADCLYLLGAEYTYDAEFESAAGVYTYLADAYAKSSYSDDALWKLGWTEFLRGGYESAEAAFGRLISGYPGSSLVDQATYWRGRALEMMGRPDDAAKNYETLRDGYALSYYGLLAGNPGGNVDAGADDPPSPVGRPGFDGSYKDPVFERAAELGIQGLDVMGARELRTAEYRYAGSAGGISEIARLYAALGEYRRPLEMGSRLYRTRMKTGRSPIPDEAMRVIFPLGFWDVITAEADRFKVDPFLVASLVREESHYDPAAVSPAGAVGLMQLMPSTAAAVCRKLGMPSPTGAKLKRGTYNVPVGTCHLGYLIEKHNGRLVYALAEYNAGSGPLNRWKERNPGAPDDVFVESISYPETRNYVKRVLRNYGVYRNLYGTLPEIPSKK